MGTCQGVALVSNMSVEFAKEPLKTLKKLQRGPSLFQHLQKSPCFVGQT